MRDFSHVNIIISYNVGEICDFLLLNGDFSDQSAPVKIRIRNTEFSFSAMKLKIGAHVKKKLQNLHFVE